MSGADPEAVGRSTAGEAERDLVHALSGALRVARLHSVDNVVTQEALQEFVERLQAALARQRRVLVVAARERLYVNGGAVRSGRGGGGWIAEFVEFLGRMGVGGLLFHGEWGLEAGRGLIEAFAAVGPEPPEERVGIIGRAAEETIELPAALRVFDVAQVLEQGEVAEGPRERADACFARLVILGERVGVALAGGGAPDDQVRAVHQALMMTVEGLEEGGLLATRLLGLTAVGHERDPWAEHGAATAVVAMAAARLLGLSRGDLADLGFAAFFHDMGRWAVGRAAATRRALEHKATRDPHVLAGVAAALRGRSFGDAGLLRLVVAQEHHRVTEHYPESDLRPPAALSRVVAAADAFDRLETGTPWSAPLGPAAVLRRLRDDGHEAAVVDLLRDTLGERPRGTLLRLRSGAVVVVVEGGAARGHRPLVRRLLRPDGRPDASDRLELLDDPDAAEELEPQGFDADLRRAVLI